MARSMTWMLGCCTRPEGPHMTLCGPWTDDTDFAPICDNDYHWNNEQEMQVWPVYTGNRLAFGEPIFRMIEDNMDTLVKQIKGHRKRELHLDGESDVLMEKVNEVISSRKYGSKMINILMK